MKNLATKLGSSAVLAVAFTQRAFAQTGGAFFSGASEAPAATAQGDLPSNVVRVINFFLGILGLVAVAFLIYAGVLMVTAGGNDEQVGKARKIITYAVVGIVIILLAYTIVQFVTNALG